MGLQKVLGLVFLFFFLHIAILPAQRFRVSGVVTDAVTKEVLAGVPVTVKELQKTGTSTNDSGAYSLSLYKGDYTLTIKFIGYKEVEIPLKVNKNISQDIALELTSVGLKEVVVSSGRTDANVAAPQVGVERVTMQEANKLPVIFGERDIIKVLQLMPGVKAASEGSAGLFVRGGTSDQNLVTLDNVPVYNASHLMGFFSTFNPNAVKDVTLYKGAMPAQYGERLSSVLDVQMRDGDMDKYHLEGGIGLIASNLSIDGPIQKGKSSFIISGRRTYADAIARLSGNSDVQNATLYFYDVNAKMNFILGSKDRLTFSGYSGRDKMAIKEAVNTDWGNLMGTLKWTHQMNSQWASSTAVQYNKYNYNINLDMGLGLHSSSKIDDYSLKEEFLYQRNPSNLWRFGYSTTYHTLTPGNYRYEEGKGEDLILQKRYSWENGLYISNSNKITDNFEVIYGLRLSTFSALGKGDFYTLDKNHEVVDSVWYGPGQFVKTYIHLEPRLSMVYKLSKVASLKAAYARTTQGMHLLTNSTMSTPMDRWVSSTNNIKPQVSDQFSLGYFRNFSNDMYEFSIEGYCKDMRNQIDYKDNAELYRNNDVETELLYGKGRAYGVELLLRKCYGQLTGWIGYTLSRSEKRIDGINNDKWYPARQDRTHDISIVGIYELNPKWTFSAAWIYYTGNAVTYPSGKYYIDGQEVIYYSERNGYRAPAYHRLDLSATCVLKKTRKFYSELAFGLYNAYGRENAYMIDFRTNDDDPNKTSAYQYSLFRFIPSISWNFKF